MPPVAVDRRSARAGARAGPAARARASSGRRVCRTGTGGGRGGADRPAAVSELGDGRFCDQGGGRARRIADRLPDRRRPAGRQAARGRRGDGDLDGRHGARRGRRGCADRERCRARQQAQRTGLCRRWSAHAADRRRRARRRPAPRRRERCSVPLRSARSLRPGSPRSRAPVGPGWSFSAPGPSCGRRARRLARARSTSRTARCSRRRSRQPARWSTGSGRSPTTRRSTAARSSGGSRRTSSSAPAACPSDRTTSSVEILGELGVEEDFWGVAVKPGKPVAFATRGATLVFGLPGNPVSALVAVELFVRPALRALQGDPGQARTMRSRASPLRCGETPPGTSSCGLGRCARAMRPCSSPLTGQESHMIARAAGADALVFVRAGEGELRRASRRGTCRWASPGPPLPRLLGLLSFGTTRSEAMRAARLRECWNRGHSALR